ncbi:MAG: SDR family NAD(P)-dependent oxidoreductase, partial [Pseudomonadota bacterium]
MDKIALITGASSGIGKEFAKYHAGKGGDVILTARRAEILKTLKSEIEEQYGVKAHVFAADLAKPDAAEKLYKDIKKAKLQVDVLINNAGFGGRGVHIERDLNRELGMIDVNVKSLVTLTHMFGHDMAARGAGKILNVGSTAGFMPGPQQAVYFATKAFVNSFSQAVDQELRDRGVTCTVLAPG